MLWVTDGTTRVSGVTVTGGNGFGNNTNPAGGPDVVGPGGGIYVQSGTLNLENVAVVDNATTSSGGGVATAGILTASGSTFARNRAAAGGGIVVTNGDAVALLNSTVSGNTAEGIRSALGGGIASVGSLLLENTTIAANQVLVGGAPAATGGGGIYQGTGQAATSVTILDSIVAANAGRACGASTQAVIDAFGGNHNLDDDGTCGFSAVGDKPGVNPQLLALANNGGPTDTQGLSAGSPAIGGGDGANCRSADQRGFARPAGACDIGAVEYYPPTQTPPSQQQELPPPVAGKTVNALPKSGRVRIKLRGSNRFVRLSEGQQVPVGTIFDTRKGHVTLVAAANRQGGTATAEFWAGLFRLGQNTKARPTTTLTLTEQLRCPKAGNASIAAKRKKKRRLWGDGSGKFRTKGKHSAATVVGTKWLVEDRCTTHAHPRGPRPGIGARLRSRQDGRRAARKALHRARRVTRPTVQAYLTRRRYSKTIPR